MRLKIFVAIMLCTVYSFAQIPVGYYSTATGVGYTLKTQLYNKIKNHTNLGYAGLWTAYATTDRDNQYENDNTIFDLYSENPIGTDPVTFLYNTNQCGTYTTQGNCYNREHIVPQSIFNSASPMQSDAHFIVPVDGYVNGMRSDNPHGNVAVASWTSLNGSKRGTSAVPGYTGTVFEPLNEFKGDIARMYFYFATRYENLVASYTSYPMFNGTSNQVFSNAFLNMLISWHNQDSVSAREIARNNAIYTLQNNRNPFIDHPEYVGMIWGGNTNPVPQSITFNSLANVPYSNDTITLNATSSSNLPISYSSSNPNVATVFDNFVTIVGVGTTTITASQNGNAFYTAATPVSQSLTIIQATQTITFNALASKVLGDSPFILTATGGASGNAITYVSSNPAVATVSGNSITIVGVGNTNITASQLGNANFLAAADVVRNLTVTNGILAGWDFSTLTGGTGINNFGASPYTATFSTANCSVGGLTRGAGILAPTTSAAAARAWGGTVNTATATSAININSFITFMIKPSIGYALDLGSINPIDYRRSSTGATNALVQYNINGGTYVPVATLNFTNNSSSGASAGTIDLSTITALQNIHSSRTITIRIIPYGGTGGSFYFYDRAVSSAYDLSILGNIRLCNSSSSNAFDTILFSATPYLWNGQSLSSSGTYTFLTINSLGCDSVATLNLTVLPNHSTLNLKAFLEGYYVTSNLMSPVLLNEGVGTNSLLCDSITVELHSSSAPYALAYTYTGVIGTNGLLACTFPGSASGNAYYIVVKHRNSIETWSASPVTVSAVTAYDFSNEISKAYGSNQASVGNGQYALFSGDMNQDGYVDGADYPLFDVDSQNGMYGIYIATDLNGDGYVDGVDYPLFDANSQYGIYSIAP
jgi:endonuclease I